MKAQICPAIKAHLVRGAFYLLLLFAMCVIPLALGERQADVRSQNENPTGFVCPDCPLPGGWRAGPDMPSPGVRMVGVVLFNFYAMGGRSMDGVGNDFTDAFEFNERSITDGRVAKAEGVAKERRT